MYDTRKQTKRLVSFEFDSNSNEQPNQASHHGDNRHLTRYYWCVHCVCVCCCRHLPFKLLLLSALARMLLHNSVLCDVEI